MTVRVLLAASGSGGHLFPAQFIARKIREICPEAEVAFAGSGRPLEEKLIDGAGFKRFVLPYEALRVRGPALFRLLWTFPKAFVATWRLFSLYNPGAVIGVGGYVSVLPVVVARLRGVPAWIHEAEAKAGRANRFLAIFAERISLAFPNADIPFRKKAVHTGHPLRPELEAFAGNGSAAAEVPTKLLVMGGSQGARALDDGLQTIAPWLTSRGIEVRHQCRAENVKALETAYAAAGVSACVVPFIENMLEAYAWADVIVSRAGAGATMELEVVSKPCVLVPFPHAQGGHQKTNALFLVSQGKALLCEEGDAFAERLRNALASIFQPEAYREMRLRRGDMRSLSAAESIAKGALALISRNIEASALNK